MAQALLWGRHYGEAEASVDTFRRALEELSMEKAGHRPAFVLVVDLLDFPIGIAPELVEKCGGEAHVLLNKADLLRNKIKVGFLCCRNFFKHVQMLRGLLTWDLALD